MSRDSHPLAESPAYPQDQGSSQGSTDSFTIVEDSQGPMTNAVTAVEEPALQDSDDDILFSCRRLKNHCTIKCTV